MASCKAAVHTARLMQRKAVVRASGGPGHGDISYIVVVFVAGLC